MLCSCFEGFRLTDDNKTCHDINECEDPSSCSQHCVNNRGSFWCKCVEGYKLESDMKRCKAAGERNPRKQASFLFSSSLPRSSGLGLDLKISSLMTSHGRDLCNVLNWFIVAHKNSNCPGTNQGHAGLVGFRFLYGTFSVESKMPKVPFCFIHMSKSVGDNFKRPFRNARFMILFSRSIALKHQGGLGNSKLPPPVTCTIWACSVQFYAFVRQIVAELS